jgi:hypothetical protein
MKLHVKNEKTFNEKATKQRIAKKQKRGFGGKERRKLDPIFPHYFLVILFFTTQNTRAQRGKKQ